MNDILSRVKRIHFIGIGGSGMCPIAEILIHRGFQISGSDNSESDTLARVRTYGIPVYMGQKAENLHDAELVVLKKIILNALPQGNVKFPKLNAVSCWEWWFAGTRTVSVFPEHMEKRRRPD